MTDSRFAALNSSSTTVLRVASAASVHKVGLTAVKKMNVAVTTMRFARQWRRCQRGLE